MHSHFLDACLRSGSLHLWFGATRVSLENEVKQNVLILKATELHYKMPLKAFAAFKANSVAQLKFLQLSREECTLRLYTWCFTWKSLRCMLLLTFHSAICSEIVHRFICCSRKHRKLLPKSRFEIWTQKTKLRKLKKPFCNAFSRKKDTCRLSELRKPWLEQLRGVFPKNLTPLPLGQENSENLAKVTPFYMQA